MQICNSSLQPDSEFRTFHKLWLIKAQLLEELYQMEEVRQTYEAALKIAEVRDERIVWLESARFEER